MSVHFGTDGIRGIVNKDLTYDTAFKCGNSLAKLMGKGKVLIGRDTRNSGDYLLLSLCSGLIAGGVDVYNVGVIPTAGISYLTMTQGFDYGVVITASHNPSEYNGIKIFSKEGLKLLDAEEKLIEKQFDRISFVEQKFLGKYKENKKLKNK